MFERVGNWLWRRWRHRFMFACFVAIVTFSLGALVPVIFLFLFLNFDDAAGVAKTLAAAMVFFPAAAAVLIWGDRTRVRAINMWGRQEQIDAVVVREALLSLPERAARRGLWVALTPAVLSGWIAYAVIDQDWRVFAGFVIGSEFTAVIALFMAAVTFRILFAPMLAEVNEIAGMPTVTERGWTLQFRFVFGAFIFTFLGSIVGSGVGARVDDEAKRYLLTLLAGLAISTYCAALIRATMARPSLQPLDHVIAATERIRAGNYDESVPFESRDELGVLTISVNEMQRGLRERASLQQAFGSYVDPSLIDRLLAQDNSVFAGEEVDVTVFFADVRGFTSYAAARTASEAVARLNDLFELVVPIIRAHGGHANGFAGDSVLAVFGTPNPLDHHADRAVAAAWEVQRTLRDRFGDDLHVGIGISSGTVIAGSVGGGGKLEFTVIGDAVNVASRVEELTKQTGDGILLTQATVDALDRTPRLLDRGHFEVRGKSEPVRLYSICQEN